jgi:hypothetical protein
VRDVFERAMEKKDYSGQRPSKFMERRMGIGRPGSDVDA